MPASVSSALAPSPKRLWRVGDSASSAVKAVLGRRDGMTLLEVLLTLAIFLAGSVGIIGLFVAAGVLHSDAVGRRTASYIAETLLSNVQAKPLHEVFARTAIATVPAGGSVGATDASVPVVATAATATSPVAQFTFQCPLFVQNDQTWAGSAASPTAINISGGLGGFWPLSINHPDGSPVLQPLTWNFVVGGAPGTSISAAAPVIPVWANLTPVTCAYIVIDKEWIRCSGFWDDTGVTTNWAPGQVSGRSITHTPGECRFIVNAAAVPDAMRGFGGTVATAHLRGVPVTVAQEYPGYPGFYYTVQYYPVNATGAEARVIVMVGFGTEKRFHIEAFEGVYTPGQY